MYIHRFILYMLINYSRNRKSHAKRMGVPSYGTEVVSYGTRVRFGGTVAWYGRIYLCMVLHTFRCMQTLGDTHTYIYMYIFWNLIALNANGMMIHFWPRRISAGLKPEDSIRVVISNVLPSNAAFDLEPQTRSGTGISIIRMQWGCLSARIGGTTSTTTRIPDISHQTNGCGSKWKTDVGPQMWMSSLVFTIQFNWGTQFLPIPKWQFGLSCDS